MRRGILLSGVLCGVLIVSLFVLTRSPVLVRIIAPVLETELGGEFSIASARLNGMNGLTLTGVRQRLPNEVGQAGEFLDVEQVELTFAWSGWRGGLIVPSDVVLHGVHVRVSESLDEPGRFNFMSLVRDRDDDGPPGLLPRIDVRSLTLEMGQHDTRGYTMGGRLEFRGGVTPVAMADGAVHYVIHLTQLGADGALALDATFDPIRTEFQAVVRDLDVSEELRAFTPIEVRFWWDQIAPSGRVSEARLHTMPGEPIAAQVSLEDVILTIPIEAETFWVRYADGEIEQGIHPPRMHVRSGRLRLEDNMLHLESLAGSVLTAQGDDDPAELPYELSGWIGPLDVGRAEYGELVRQLRETTPFAMEITSGEIAFGSDDPDEFTGIELPFAVARIVRDFTLTSARLRTQARVFRELNGEEGIQAAGVLDIHDGQGRYHRFPYPVTGLEGLIRFTHDSVDIDSIRGLASGGVPIHVTGWARPLTRSSEVSLHITSEGIPVDEVLSEALGGGTRAAVDALLHTPSQASLVAADLWPWDHGVTQPLGRVDLDLHVYRPYGQGVRTTTTGTINLDGVVLVYERFPYPVEVISGSLEVEDTSIELRDVLIRTPAGGQGVVTGRIDTPRTEDGRRTIPDVTIRVTGDRLNPSLLAAIPLTDQERLVDDDEMTVHWPGEMRSQAAAFLEQLGLDGRIDYTGRIYQNADDELDWRFDVVCNDGKILPDDGIGHELAEYGLAWPTGFTLAEVEASLTIDPTGVRINSLAGRRQGGVFSMEGDIPFGTDSGGMTLRMTLENMPIEASLMSVAPGEATTFQALWDRFQPTGRFDAAIVIGSDEFGQGVRELRFLPRELTLNVNGESLRLHFEEGEMRFIDQRVEMEDVLLGIRDHLGRTSQARLSGWFDLAPGTGRVAVSGEVMGVPFDASWLFELIAFAGADSTASGYRSLGLEGRFDGRFSFGYDREGDEAPEYVALLNVLSLATQRRGHRFEAEINDGARVQVLPGEVRLERFGGVTTSGGRFEVDGVILLTEEPSADLTVSFEGDGLHSDLLTFLPQAVEDAFLAMNLRVMESLRLLPARLLLQFDDAFGVSFAEYEGAVEVVDAAMDAGVSFEAMIGAIDVGVSWRRDQPIRGEFLVRLTSTMAAGRELRNAQADLVFSDDGSVLVMERFVARLGGGGISAIATVDLTESANYRVEIDLAGARLQSIALTEASGQASQSGVRPDSDGIVLGGLSLSGRIDDPLSRRGRGSFKVLHGRMTSHPLTVGLLQLSQLALPFADGFSYAEGTFFVRGEDVVIEHLMMENPSILLRGDGYMGFSTFELDLRLRSRGKLGGLSNLVGEISDQFYAIRIGGTLANPQPSLVPIPGLTGFLDDSWYDRRRTPVNASPATDGADGRRE